MEVILSVLPYILNVASGVILAICTYNISKYRNEKKEENKKTQALADGVEALLRESIVEAFNKYTDKGYCPVYAKDSLKRAYAAYHTLGGNDVATELYHKCLAMPENPQKP